MVCCLQTDFIVSNLATQSRRFFFFFFLAIPLAIELQMILFSEFSYLLQEFAITVRSKYMDVNQPAMPWKICITSNVFFAALVVSFKRLCFYL